MDSRTALHPGQLGIRRRQGAAAFRNGVARSASAILGTENDPVFQTQRVGIESFRADVPDGTYSVYLYWAELDAAEKQEALATTSVRRRPAAIYGTPFDVSVNGRKALENFSIAAEVGFSRAMVRKVEVIVRDGKGLRVDFGRIEGEPVLNAIRIYRNH